MITCVSQIRHELLNDTYEHMRINHSLYKDKVDSFGFSALYYFKLRLIEISNISALEKLGFKELYPNAYKIYHLKNHSYYSHSIGRAKVVFVFLGYDETGAVDVNAVHTFFMRGFDVILVDARKENVRLYDVLDIAYRYSSKDITLFYIGSHGTESSLRSNMHTIPILGHDEKLQYRDGTLEITNYVKDSINTANFIRGLSYAASGYSAKITSFLIDMPWFFPAGKKINVLLASCNGQLAAFDTKYILEAGSEILILGENHYVQGNQHIVHVTNQDEINMLDYIAHNKISDISIANLMRVWPYN